MARPQRKQRRPDGPPPSPERPRPGTTKPRRASRAEGHPGRPHQAGHAPYAGLALSGALVFFAGLAWLVYREQLSPGLLWLYLATSGVTFIAYWRDKSAARNDQWRIKEKTLHLLALAGGWPGALVARQVFRHKTRKPAFRLLFWLTVLVNWGALGWLIAQRALPGH